VEGPWEFANFIIRTRSKVRSLADPLKYDRGI
jgi:hypothetical protein